MEKKWYHQWWVYVLIAVIFFLIGYIIFREKDITTEREVYVTKIEKLAIEIDSLEALYKLAVEKKDKVKIIREKIDITKDVKKLQELISELEKVKLEPVKRNSTVIELKEYLEKEF